MSRLVSARRGERLLAPRLPAIAGGAAVLGGLSWLLLVPAVELERRNLLTYDGYNRLLAVPLLLFAVALSAAPRALPAPGRLARVGFAVAATGAGLLLIGNVVEFYGVLFQGDLNAYAAFQASRADHWIGSDVGWIIFGVGMLVLLGGGLVASVALRRRRTDPGWLAAFAGTLGIGVLAGNLFGLEAVYLSVPVLALYATGWICFGLHVLRAGTVVTGAASSPGEPRTPDR